ncbi:MAG TPA: orotidine-5'-phosphate decarboxylase [Pseudolysinimonas sp.]|nr:orotidine-5'-phosphate decarboxylase [Pseudolysinimonas sp.]
MANVRPFANRVADMMARFGPLCVGIDPHSSLLESWGLPDSADGVREFGLRVVESSVGRVGILKPQIAFFERHGSAGYAALEDVIAAARAAELLVIADVKRGDVGTSVDAYGDAWLAPESPLAVDAMTAVAYQGLGSLAGVMAKAASWGAGVFVLAATSNPEAAVTQQARRADGVSVAAGVLADIREQATGSVGVVVGATITMDDFGFTAEDLAGLLILAPGFGAQGAQIADVPRLYGAATPQVLVSVSRSILSGGAGAVADRIDFANSETASWRA